MILEKTKKFPLTFLERPQKVRKCFKSFDGFLRDLTEKKERYAVKRAKCPKLKTVKKRGYTKCNRPSAVRQARCESFGIDGKEKVWYDFRR